MKNKSLRRSLLMSVVSLATCATMFVGTTFAWFTDSVTSSNNIIVSGNLDVELYYQAEGEDWAPVNANTNVFMENALWEPGHTEVVKLKVVNEGSLALKYNLGVNVASETGSVNVEGKEFLLSDYIKYGIVDGAQTYTRDTAVAAVEATATKLNQAYNSGVTPLKANEEKVVTMVVYMPQEVGNEANFAKDAAKPVINLGINLRATQDTYEEDSFNNQYDENAPFSIWNGVVPTEMPATLVVDGATQTIHVKDADAFVYLNTLSDKWVEFYTDGNGTEWVNYANGAGADYYYSDRWSVSLEADIDLNNYAIQPIMLKFGEATGASAFNGNYHTIRNINTTTGLFVDHARASLSNLTLDNVKATRGALIGSANHTISNVTVQNASISGVDYVGGLVGSAYAKVKHCAVIDSSVVATGKEAGGLIGYIETSSESFVANNTVKNVYVSANNRAAGLVAQVNVNVKVYGNTVDTVTVGVKDTTKYQPDAVVSNALAPANVYDNTVTNANVYSNLANVTDNAQLKDAITNSSAVVLAEGEFSLPTLSSKEGMTIIGAADGSTVIGGENASTGFASNFGKNTTMTNLTFSGSSNGVRWSYANGGESTFNNCVFAGDSVYGFHIDSSNGATFTFNNCTFKGFNAFAGDLAKVVFNNCTFLSNGHYGHTNIWSVAELNNCTFGDDTSIGTRGDSAHIFFDGVEESYYHANVTNAADFNEALNNGAKEIYAEGVVVEGTTQLNTGATIIGATFKADDVAVTQTISGTFKDCVFEASEALRWCYTKEGETVVFENCEIKTDFRGVHFDDMKGDVIFRNCKINGFNAIGGDGTVTFENCTFGNDQSSYNGLNMYSNITLINCTFNFESGKTNFIDMEGNGKTLTITNCKATLDGVEVDIANYVGGSKLAQNTVIYN